MNDSIKLELTIHAFEVVVILKEILPCKFIPEGYVVGDVSFDSFGHDFVIKLVAKKEIGKVPTEES
jgi:hypothetical protein